MIAQIGSSNNKSNKIPPSNKNTGSNEINPTVDAVEEGRMLSSPYCMAYFQQDLNTTIFLDIQRIFTFLLW